MLKQDIKITIQTQNQEYTIDEKQISFTDNKVIKINDLEDIPVKEWKEIAIICEHKPEIKPDLKIENLEQISQPFFAKGQKRGVSKNLNDEPLVDTGDKTIWLWQPQNYVGVYKFYLILSTDSLTETYHFYLEVSPYKIDRDRFYFLLNDIRKKHLNLYNWLSPVKIGEERKEVFSDIIEQYNSLKKHFDVLERVIYRIAQNPQKKLIKLSEQVNLFEVREINLDVIYKIAAGRTTFIKPHKPDIIPTLQNKLKGFIPEHLDNRKTIISFDCLENRLIKRFLNLIYSNMEAFKSIVKNTAIADKESILNQCNDFQIRTLGMKKLDFLQDVSDIYEQERITLQLLRERNYMSFYSIYKEFINRPYFDRSHIFNIGIKDLPSLYEYWVLLYILEALKSLCLDSGYKLIKNDIFQKDELSFLYEIKENTYILELQKKEITLKLQYQPLYKTYTDRPYYPDYSIEIFKENKLKEIIVLDAKYRWKLEYEDDKEDAIGQMHRYKDAIVKDDFRPVKKAILIYVWNENKIYKFDNSDYIRAESLIPDCNETIFINNLTDILVNCLSDYSPSQKYMQLKKELE